MPGPGGLLPHSLLSVLVSPFVLRSYPQLRHGYVSAEGKFEQREVYDRLN